MNWCECFSSRPNELLKKSSFTQREETKGYNYEKKKRENEVTTQPS